MEGEIICLIRGQFLYTDSEYLSGPSLGVDGINDNDFSGPLFAQYKIKENTPDACSCIDDRDILREEATPLEMVHHGRPESVITEKDIPASQNNDVFVDCL